MLVVIGSGIEVKTSVGVCWREKAWRQVNAVICMTVLPRRVAFHFFRCFRARFDLRGVAVGSFWVGVDGSGSPGGESLGFESPVGVSFLPCGQYNLASSNLVALSHV